MDATARLQPDGLCAVSTTLGTLSVHTPRSTYQPLSCLAATALFLLKSAYWSAHSSAPPCAVCLLCVECYFNSALQCLLSIPPLLGFFSRPSSLECVVRDVSAAAGRSSGRLAKAFAALCSQLAVGQSAESMSRAAVGSVSPSSLLRCFTSLDVSFGDSGQHDSQELLRCFVSRLHDDVNRVRHAPPYEQLEERAGESEWQQSDRYFANYTARHRSIVTDLFAGQLRSEIRCRRCRTRRVAFDPFLDLSLPLPHQSARGAADDTVTLAQCFAAFTASEQLSDDNAIFCPNCKAHTDSSKALSLHRLPSVLVVHLKRFEFNSHGGRRKLNTPIAAPLSLELPMSAGPQLSPALHRYTLFATINHLGSAHGGHYIAHAQVGGHWYTFNDSHVHQIDDKQMTSQHIQSAYVLFYQAAKT